MPLTVGCPDASALRGYHLGQASRAEAELIERHLEGCGRCAQTLHGLSGADVLVEALQSWGSRPCGPEEPEVAGLVETLSRFRPPDDPATLALTPPGPAREPAPPKDPELTQEEYAILAPPEGPDELGRLGGYR